VRTATTRRWYAGVARRPSLRKICRMCVSTVRELRKALADAVVRVALGHEAKHLALAVGELFERAGASARHQPGDDCRVDDAFAVADAAERVGEDGDVGDAVLEQVSSALGVLLEQAHRVARLEVVREDQDTDLGVALSYLLGRGEPFVGMCRRHLDVDYDEVRPT
jgi:hypothetical protein